MPNKKTLKIGLDFHGVITANPKYFKDFCGLAINKGYEIHVISGGPEQTIMQFLEKWGIKYTAIFAIVDYWDALGMVTFFEDGTFKVDEKFWDEAKGLYCDEHEIDLQIDDTSKYSKSFTTPFCHYDAKHHCCTLDNGQKIDLHDNPSQSLAEIEHLLIS